MTPLTNFQLQDEKLYNIAPPLSAFWLSKKKNPVFVMLNPYCEEQRPLNMLVVPVSNARLSHKQLNNPVHHSHIEAIM